MGARPTPAPVTTRAPLPRPNAAAVRVMAAITRTERCPRRVPPRRRRPKPPQARQANPDAAADPGDVRGRADHFATAAADPRRHDYFKADFFNTIRRKQTPGGGRWLRSTMGDQWVVARILQPGPAPPLLAGSPTRPDALPAYRVWASGEALVSYVPGQGLSNSLPARPRDRGRSLVD
jgi:hypothetical protein